MPTIFEFTSYKVALNDLHLEKKVSFSKQYNFQNMAKFCGIQKTYLSKVLAHDGHLTSDQLFSACEFLGLNQKERDYIFCLYECERSQNAKRREELNQKLQLLRAEIKKTEKNIPVKSLNSASPDLVEYYINPDFQLVHMFLTIPKYASNIRLIQLRLGLADDVFSNILRKLQNNNIITVKNGKFQSIVDNIHLPSDSYLFPAYKKLIRLKSMSKFDNGLNKNNFNFSVSFSCSVQTKESIHQEILKTIQRIQNKVTASPQEEVYQLNLDLFSWSEE